MDTTTAQAIHDLATTGRLSAESTEAVSDALGLDTDTSEGDDTKASTKQAAKGSGR
jgi:hypothetical protein